MEKSSPTSSLGSTFFEKESHRALLWILVASLVARVLAAFANVGFMAIDDYIYMLKLACPAQDVPSVKEVVASSWVHPPVPMLLLTRLSQWPLLLGIEDPLHQIQVVYFLMGLSGMVPVYLAYRLLADFGRRAEGCIAAGLVGLHAIMPFFSTRVLFETFSMPLIFASLYFFSRYYRQRTRWDLFYAVAMITAASLVRFQAGVCFLAMIGVVLATQRLRRDIPVFAGMSLLFFGVSGLVDVLLGRSFHQSFLEYVNYNLNHSSDYGTSPFYNYILLFLGMSLPPLFLRRWKGFAWREKYQGLQPALWFFLVFLVTHSAVPHKEDRFMIPIVPVFLLLLAPLLARLIEERAYLRLKIFTGLNVLILVLASSFTSQWNTIGVARFLNDRLDLETLRIYDGSLSFTPTAYMHRPKLNIEKLSKQAVEYRPDCREVLAVRQDRMPHFQEKNWSLVKVAQSNPGPLEWLVVQTNRKHNRRRDTIHLYQAESCSQQPTAGG